MYTYRDYFPRRILRECGVSPDKPLVDSLSARFAGKDRLGEIKKSMSEVYSVFVRAASEKGDLPEKWLQEARIEQRILSAFFDMDVLQERDRETVADGFHLSETGERKERTAAREERVAIEVPETEEKEVADLSPKADDPAVMPRGKTL